MALMLHAGGRIVDRDQLSNVELPQATRTWHPIPHVKVLDTVRDNLNAAGYTVAKESLALSKSGAKFFGVLDLTSPLTDGVSLTVGLRNSINKTFPMGFCAGSRVFVCDNLAFHAELMVRRKHTRYGIIRFDDAITTAIQGLTQFKLQEVQRIEKLQATEIDSKTAESLILRAAVDKGIIPLAKVGDVLSEYRKPRHQEFEKPCAWSLYNAFTEVLKGTPPDVLARRTMRLGSFLAV